MQFCLLHLIVAPSLEETIVDWLLNQPAITGFSSIEIYGHGANESAFNLIEQVTGRQRRVQFIIHTENEIASQMVLELKQTLAGAGIHYFLIPVSEFGHI